MTRMQFNLFIYNLSGWVFVILGVLLFVSTYSNRNFPSLNETRTITGIVSESHPKLFAYEFSLEGYNESFTYYMNYGGFNEFKKKIQHKGAAVEMIVAAKGSISDSVIYAISIDNVKVTDFSKKKSMHKELTNEGYAVTLSFIFGSLFCMWFVGPVYGNRSSS